MDKDRLSQSISTLEGQVKTFKKDKDAAAVLHQKIVQNQTVMIQDLNKCIENLNPEISTLKGHILEIEEDQKSGWAEEKNKNDEEHFEHDFRFYAVGFLANDPDYDFTNFGEETIKARRIELDLKEGSPVAENEGTASKHKTIIEDAKSTPQPIDRTVLLQMAENVVLLDPFPSQIVAEATKDTLPE